MAARSPETTRNVAVCGHGTCGKTSLIEALLTKAGAISRPGNVDDGTTVCDFDEQEKERQHSIDLATVHLQHKGVTVNVIDTPGYRDFVGHIYSAASAVECIVVVVDADDGVRPNTRKAWEIAEAAEIPRLVVINRLDREHGKSDEIVAQIREQLSPSCSPLNLPDGVGSSFSAVSSALDGEGGDELLESVVESNDELMERYLGGEEISPDEVKAQLSQAVGSRSVFPVFFTSVGKDIGVTELLDALVDLVPPASDALGRTVHSPETPDEASPLPTTIDGPFLGFVFRVASDPFVGKLTYVRVFSGSLQANASFINPNTGKPEKAGKFVRLQGKEQEPLDQGVAGDIITLVKVEGLNAFDTIYLDSPAVTMDSLKLPTPMYSRAVLPKSKADEKKFAEAIHKVVDEDIMVASARDNRTHEMVVSGVSQLHLGIIWDRLKGRYGVEVETKEPKTPYLETITVKAEDFHRHKKQSGGSGEFAEVHLRVEPLDRGGGLEFVSSVFGGAISSSYVQSAEKGIRSKMEEGVIAGYPVVDVKVDIYDGKEHPVDSKDIAFQKAGREAFKKAVEKARPALLEPIVDLEVTFPSDNMGDIQGDLNRRRGRVIGMDAAGSFQVLKAKVPLAEVADYATTLGSMTGGQGTYGVEMSHYEAVPANVQQKLRDAAKSVMQKGDD